MGGGKGRTGDRRYGKKGRNVGWEGCATKGGGKERRKDKLRIRTDEAEDVGTGGWIKELEWTSEQMRE